MADPRPKLDVWTPQSTLLQALRAPLAQAMEAEVRDLDLWKEAGGQPGDEIEDVEVEQVKGPSFIEAMPHTDEMFKRYFVLYVLSGPQDKQLQAWAGGEWRAVFRSGRKPAAVASLAPGQMLIFDAHQVHAAALTRPEDRAISRRIKRMGEARVGYPETLERDCLAKGITREQVQQLQTRCLCIEFDTRPTRAEAEVLLESHVRVCAPKLTAQILTACAAPTPPMRTKRRP